MIRLNKIRLTLFSLFILLIFAFNAILNFCLLTIFDVNLFLFFLFLFLSFFFFFILFKTNWVNFFNYSWFKTELLYSTFRSLKYYQRIKHWRIWHDLQLKSCYKSSCDIKIASFFSFSVIFDWSLFRRYSNSENFTNFILYSL
jgi:hypothetical protein